MRRLTRAFKGGARAARDVDGLMRSALLATLDRDLDRTEELLTRAVRIDSNHVESFVALARLFRMRGEIGRAIRIHQNLMLRSDLPEAQRVEILADLAADFQQGGFLRRAIASYEEVVSRDARHRDALRALSTLLAEARDFQRALEIARKLARLEGRKSASVEAGLYVDMAEAARAEGRNDDARKAAKRALRRDKTLVRAWVTLGELEAERGRSKAALAAWSRVPVIDRGSGPLVYPQLEATYAALGRARDFEKMLRDLLEERPDDGGARLALAQTLAARGDIDEAMKEMRGLLDSEPEDLAVHGALGRILLAEGRDADACRVLAELLDALDRRDLLRAPEKLE
ncbi:MAG: tetratricopeptide repeat protein [Myxococcota bacterium]